MGNRASARDDTRTYREGYPGKRDDPGAKMNLEFYQGTQTTLPGREYIVKFHTPVEQGGHRGDYKWLEWDHSYVQWLFPIREQGLNYQAQELQLHEARVIASTPQLQDRIIESYITMLDFYGMELVDRSTGKVGRGRMPEQTELYRNLNQSFHNNLRITRILKCLGEMGLEHYKKHFLAHVFREIYEHGNLVKCRESAMDYWAPTLRNESDYQDIATLVETLHAEHHGRRNLPAGKPKGDPYEHGDPYSRGATARTSPRRSADVAPAAAAAPSGVKGLQPVEEEHKDTEGMTSPTVTGGRPSHSHNAASRCAGLKDKDGEPLSPVETGGRPIYEHDAAPRCEALKPEEEAEKEGA